MSGTMKDLFGTTVVCNIGYQGRTPAELIALLQAEDIEILVDLREKPYGRRYEFNKSRLSVLLPNEGIEYRWMGDKLGGFTCTPEMWAAGCVTLAELAASKNVAILCMERSWNDCHRKQISEILTSQYGLECKPL